MRSHAVRACRQILSTQQTIELRVAQSWVCVLNHAWPAHTSIQQLGFLVSLRTVDKCWRYDRIGAVVAAIGSCHW
jgi:hypothetical protein